MQGPPNSPLTLAAHWGRVDEVRELLDGGAVIDDRDGDSYTALISAARFGKLDVVEPLLARGADPNALTSHHKTALMDAADQGHLEVELHMRTSSPADVKRLFEAMAAPETDTDVGLAVAEFIRNKQ